MEPPPSDNNNNNNILHDVDGGPANLGLGIHNDGRYEPLPSHDHRGVYRNPASHLHHHAQQQLQHHGHGPGGGSAGQQHPEQQQQQQQQHNHLHSHISPHLPHYGYPNYHNYAHHHPPNHQHHHLPAAAAAMNYQSYPTSPYPPAPYHQPVASSITYQYDAPHRPEAAAKAALTATTTTTNTYPQYHPQDLHHLKQSEYLHQQYYHHQYHPPPPPPTQHQEVPPPPPHHHHHSHNHPGGDTERQKMKDVELQSREQQQQQQQVDEVWLENKKRSPSSEQREVQLLIKVPDSTLDQPKPIDIPDSTGEKMDSAEDEPPATPIQHEENAIASDSYTDVATSLNAVDAVTKTLQADERLGRKDKNKEDKEDPKTSTTNATCDTEQTPLPDNESVTVPKTSLSEASVHYKDDTTHSTENVFPFDTILTILHEYEAKYQSRSVPSSHPTFIDIVSNLVQHGIEDEADLLWERNFTLLREYKERAGDCDVPFTANELGPWVVRQRELYAKQQVLDQQQQQQKELVQTSSRQSTTATQMHKIYMSRFERLTKLGFDFDTPMWDVRFQELISYKSIHNHCSPPVSYPKLGIWTINQRFNLKDMPKERVEALDSLGFVWNHNRKNRSQEKWDGRYEELCEYQKQNGHCNVPATYRHSPLGTWVGKQREEYKKLKDKKSSQLDKYRIDKLNEIGFQWSLLNWTTVSWDDRFEALRAFKEQHGHVKIPRNHRDFGNWPLYQKSQFKLFKEGKKSKLTKEKVDKLIQIGFLESDETPSLSAQAKAASVAQTGGDYDSFEWYQSV